MSQPPKKNTFQRILLWLGPLFVLLLLTLAGFLYWLVATETGAQWLIRTAAHQMDGESRGVRGNIWSGLEVAEFKGSLPDVELSFSGLVLGADWKKLLNRQLHINEFSLESLSLRLDLEESTEPDAETPPFRMPELPVSIDINRLALGKLNVEINGEALPVDVSDLVSELRLNNQQGLARVHNVELSYQEIVSRSKATLVLNTLQAPWDMLAELEVQAYATTPDSLLCANRYLPGVALESQDEQFCALQLESTLEGSLDELNVALRGLGQGVSIKADVNAAPQASFPLRDTHVAIDLADGTALNVDLTWSQELLDTLTFDRVRGSVYSKKLDLAALLADQGLPAVISAEGKYDVLLAEGFEPRKASIDLILAQPSSWNSQPASGHVNIHVDARELPAGVPFWHGYVINDSDVSLTLGHNHVALKGALGLRDDQLSLKVEASNPEEISSVLSEVGALEVEGVVGGSVLEHQLDLKAKYALSVHDTGQIGEGPIEAELSLRAQFTDETDTQAARWRGTVTTLTAEHADIQLVTLNPFDVDLRLASAEQGISLQVAPVGVQLDLASKPWFVLNHEGSSYEGEGWKTKGHINPVAIDPARIALLTEKLGINIEQKKEGGVKDNRTSRRAPLADLTVDANWDLAFNGALAGKVGVRRLSGDVLVPLDPSFPLGLKTLALDVLIKPSGGANSQIQTEFTVATEQMGRIDATVQSLLRYTPEAGFHMLESDLIRAQVKADINDLSWTSLILGDAMELGGALTAELTAQLRTNGEYTSEGFIRGKNLRVTRLDDGVRLLDGTLEARIDKDVFTLEKLYFPAVLRVEPKEWRTATWVSENPDAQGGSLNLTGQWRLNDSSGRFVADLNRYPILQRADRYAMVTGQLTANIALPHIALSGKIVADAGWFNLDMLGGIPTIDSDIVILRAGESLVEEDVEPPTDITLDLDVDLGPRFYLTGYGVNSGLVGQLRITMMDGSLTGVGALRTRGGAIEQYGQRLQLRRGTITFQGDIANPILDIEALRTGLAVQAGVKVVGTARKPKIDLVSYPDVEHVEKLSWLLFGHGSDDSAGDIALLFSVGTSFLGGDEPFYRQFGIDELAMRSGEIGSAGSILPVESSVSGIDGHTSDVERQFLQVTKQVSTDITLSLQQALSDTGTVGRASYRLARGLTAELSVGTVNGIALIYRWFSRD